MSYKRDNSSEYLAARIVLIPRTVRKRINL